jgi:uncharacterized phiE125 gp8 family phage protein
MTARLIMPPAALPITLDSAKKNLKIDGTDQDDVVSDWVRGIVAYVEFCTQRALINQRWRVTLDKFPGAIRLDKPPTVSVNEVQFLDASGVRQTLDPADYLVDAVSEPGYVVPGRGKAWPTTYPEINAVTVDYTCGYGTGPEAVPAGIKLYILAKLREQFDPAVRVERDTVQSSFIDGQLDQFKVYG